MKGVRSKRFVFMPIELDVAHMGIYTVAVKS